MASIIVGLLGTGGDVWPGLSIAATLQRRGHDVVILAPESFERAARDKELEFHAIDSAQAYVSDVTDARFWGPQGTALGLAPGGYLHRATQPAFEYVEARRGSRPLLLCTRNVYGLRFAAERFGLACACVAYSSTQFQGVGRMPYAYPLLRRLPKWWQSAALDWGDSINNKVLVPRMNDMRETFGLSAIDHFRRWSFFRHPNIALYPAWYDDVSTLSDRGVYQGEFVFSHTDECAPLPPRLESFLQAGPAPIVFTFGTGVGHVKERFVEVLKALRSRPWRAVLVSSFEANLPDGLTTDDKVLAVPYANFAALLPRASLLVHHGGIGTAAQAIRAGIPQLILPLAFDQPDNAARIQALRLGASLRASRVTARLLIQCIEKAIHGTDYACLTQMRAALLETRGDEIAADLCERAWADSS